MTSSLQGLAFFVQTFGCQMNKHDSERVVGMLESLGALQVSSVEDSDIAIYLTCCVREAADERLYGQVASIKNIPLPESSAVDKRIIAVGGCIGQRDGVALFERLPHLDVVFGTNTIASLPRLLQKSLESTGHYSHLLEESPDFPTALPQTREHSWAAWVPITIGCNNFCTYCIVPYVRGREKSRPMDDVIREVQSYAQSGVKEVTLLGQNVNSYGRDLYGSPRFAELLAAVSATGIERIRFATSHPKDLSAEVISLFGKLPNIMPALHLPVQSGSNAILEKMNRKYTREHYLELIRELRSVCPEIALSTDVIVGFPGETEEDFQLTYDLVAEVGYNQVFTFIYSKRAGTPAARIYDPTSRDTIQNRFDRLVDVVQQSAYDANQKDLHAVLPVLVEGTSKKDSTLLTGKSPKNTTVHFPLPASQNIEELVGSIVQVRIDAAKTWYLSGTIV